MKSWSSLVAPDRAIGLIMRVSVPFARGDNYAGTGGPPIGSSHGYPEVAPVGWTSWSPTFLTPTAQVGRLPTSYRGRASPTASPNKQAGARGTPWPLADALEVGLDVATFKRCWQ